MGSILGRRIIFRRGPERKGILGKEVLRKVGTSTWGRHKSWGTWASNGHTWETGSSGRTGVRKSGIGTGRMKRWTMGKFLMRSVSLLGTVRGRDPSPI